MSPTDHSGELLPDGLPRTRLGKIVNGTDDVTAGFDPTMQQHLSADRLSAGWADFQEQFGSYKSHCDPADEPRGESTVVDVPLAMPNAPGLFRIAFDQDGHIAGLFLLKARTAVP